MKEKIVTPNLFFKWFKNNWSTTIIIVTLIVTVYGYITSTQVTAYNVKKLQDKELIKENIEDLNDLINEKNSRINKLQYRNICRDISISRKKSKETIETLLEEIRKDSEEILKLEQEVERLIEDKKEEKDKLKGIYYRTLPLNSDEVLVNLNELQE